MGNFRMQFIRVGPTRIRVEVSRWRFGIFVSGFLNRPAPSWVLHLFTNKQLPAISMHPTFAGISQVAFEVSCSGELGFCQILPSDFLPCTHGATQKHTERANFHVQLRLIYLRTQDRLAKAIPLLARSEVNFTINFTMGTAQ